LEYAIANKYLDEDYHLFGEDKNHQKFNFIHLDKESEEYKEIFRGV
jgi:hypothetical protein